MTSGSYGKGFDPPSEFNRLSPREKSALLAWVDYALMSATGCRYDSYTLKHRYEEESGVYITNGAMKGVLKKAGYRAKDSKERSPRYSIRVQPLNPRRVEEVRRILDPSRERPGVLI
jgi:hypothetical protein